MREFKPILGIDEISKSRLINVSVITQDGKETSITLSAADQVKLIKEKLLGDAAAKDLPSYKVILLSPRRVLEDQRTIEQEGIVEDDQFIVCSKRRWNGSSPFRKNNSYSSKGPDCAVIKKYTEFLGNEKGSAAEALPGLAYAGMFDFFGELKRILVSLTDVASLVQHVNTEDGQEESENMDTDEEDVQIDPLLLQKLTDMGFAEAHGRKALIINQMCPLQAMEWLLQHVKDEDIDRPLTSEEIAYYIPEKGRKRRRAGANPKREFKANPRVLSNLKEMGFEEKDILEALQNTNNNEERALDWLLGIRQQSADSNPDGGLDPSSPLYTAIMDHPVVQLGMTNPRILHAFEDMLENPGNSGQYINDPEIGPVLLQISRIVQSFSR